MRKHYFKISLKTFMLIVLILSISAGALARHRKIAPVSDATVFCLICSVNNWKATCGQDEADSSMTGVLLLENNQLDSIINFAQDNPRIWGKRRLSESRLPSAVSSDPLIIAGERHRSINSDITSGVSSHVVGQGILCDSYLLYGQINEVRNLLCLDKHYDIYGVASFDIAVHKNTLINKENKEHCVPKRLQIKKEIRYIGNPGKSLIAIPAEIDDTLMIIMFIVL